MAVPHFSVLRHDYINKSIYKKGCDVDYYLAAPEINIGDVIQTIAARQYLPYVSDYIDRDGLIYYDGLETNMIFNGWFYIYDANKFIPDSFNCYVTSIYLKNPHTIPNSFITSLKRYEPIGCRDISTKNYLQSKGVASYFSGCLTLTLGKTYSLKETTREGIIFVDCENKPSVSPDIYNKLLRSVKSILKKYEGVHTIEYLRHMYDHRICLSDQYSIADRLLKKYAKAELVITTRIHCALPYLALETPCILLTPKFDTSRFSGISKFFNIIGVDENGKYIYDVNFIGNRVVNKNIHMPYAKRLDHEITQFITSIGI